MRDQKQPQPYHERLLALGKQGDVSREGQDDGVEHHGAEQVAGHADNHGFARRRADHGNAHCCCVEDERKPERSHALLYNGSQQLGSFAHTAPTHTPSVPLSVVKSESFVSQQQPGTRRAEPTPREA